MLETLNYIVFEKYLCNDDDDDNGDDDDCITKNTKKIYFLKTISQALYLHSYSYHYPYN